MAALNAGLQTGLANSLDEAILAAGAPPEGGAEQFAAWSAKGMRVLGVATRLVAAGETARERDLTLAGFLLAVL